MHCYSQGQYDRHDRIRGDLAQCAQLAGSNVHRFRTEHVVPVRSSSPSDVLLESDKTFTLENNGQRLCVDVTSVTTLGRERSHPVQAHGRLKHPKAGETAHFKDHQKVATGNKFIDGTDLSYLPAAVTDLGHQGEGMLSTLDYLAGCKRGPDTGARDALIWRCAQLVSVGAMRGIAESYYRARRTSYNRLKATLVLPSTRPYPTSIFRLRQPILNVSPVAHSDLAARPPSSSSAANRRLPTELTHTSVPTRFAP